MSGSARPTTRSRASSRRARSRPSDEAASLARDWGADWGCDDDVSPLRTVLVRRPGDEWNGVRADCWDEDAQALVDPERHWFWESRALPDVARMGAEHDGLVAALRAEGVEVRGRRPDAAPG